MVQYGNSHHLEPGNCKQAPSWTQQWPRRVARSQQSVLVSAAMTCRNVIAVTWNQELSGSVISNLGKSANIQLHDGRTFPRL